MRSRSRTPPHATIKITHQAAILNPADESAKGALVSCNGASEAFLQVQEKFQDTRQSWDDLNVVLDSLPLSCLTARDERHHALLHFAARSPNHALNLVKKILALWEHNGFDAVADVKCDALFGAAAWGNADVCQHIINSSTNVNVANKDGQTALFFAVDIQREDYCTRSVETAKLLIKLSADVHHTDDYKRTPLFFAADCPCSADCVDLLLRKQADPNLLDVNRRNPVFHAARAGHVPSLRSLARARADVHCLDKFCHNALRFAIKASRGDAAMALLQDFGLGLPLSDGHGKSDEHGDGTCLSMAAERGLTFVRDRLLFMLACFDAVKRDTAQQFHARLHANPSHRPNTCGRTLLHEAAARTDRDAAALCDLLIHTYRISVNARDHFGKTPLFHAVSSKNLNTLKSLIKSEADANILDNDRRTSLFYAVQLKSHADGASSAEVGTIKALVRAMTAASKLETLWDCRCMQVS